MSARGAAVVEIWELEGGECTVSKTTAIEWLFRRFNNGETSLEDQPRSGRPSTTMNIEALPERTGGAATTKKYSQIIVG